MEAITELIHKINLHYVMQLLWTLNLYHSKSKVNILEKLLLSA